MKFLNIIGTIQREPLPSPWACLILVAIILPGSALAGTQSKAKSPMTTQVATLGGGCFWCIEAVYERKDGVISVTSGYAGGKIPHPDYKQVCTGTTGHAEVVQIKFNPEVISYEEILDLFWAAHNPTTVNRQGADVGSQYRSIILYHNEEQKRIAEQSKARAASQFSEPIVTEIKALENFYPAEDYHQDYFQKNPGQPYCSVVIRPKLEKLLHQGKISSSVAK